MDNFATQQKKDKVLLAIGVVALIIFVLLILLIYAQGPYSRTDDISQPVVHKSSEKNLISNEIVLSAKAAVVWDMKNKKFIYEKNKDEVLPLASLAKLMTALTATELLPKKSTVTIAGKYLGDDTKDIGLLANEHWQADDLLALTLVSSSNDGAKAIASVAGAFLPKSQSIDPRVAFLQNLNEKAVEIGLDSTHFYNESGLDVDLVQSGAYGNAKDVARLMDYILKNHPELLAATTNSRMFISSEDTTHNVKNTNSTVAQIPGALGSKTGYTDLAQGNLVVAFSPGLEGPYIAVVLGSTYDGRFEDINTLIAATLEATNK